MAQDRGDVLIHQPEIAEQLALERLAVFMGLDCGAGGGGEYFGLAAETQQAFQLDASGVNIGNVVRHADVSRRIRHSRFGSGAGLFGPRSNRSVF